MEDDPDFVWVVTQRQKSTGSICNMVFKHWKDLIKAIKKEFENEDALDDFNEKEIEEQLYCDDGNYEYYISDHVVFREVE